MRKTWDECFVETLKVFKQRSACAKTQQCAIIVKDNRIISIGINGPRSGDINCTEDGGEKACGKDLANSCLRAIHAEQNAIGFLIKHGSGIGTEGCTIFVTETPCLMCAKLIVASGIKKYVYIDEYRLDEGKQYLLASNVKVIQYGN